MATWFYHLSNRVLSIVFNVALDLKLSGLEHVPRTGPLIVAINHSSFIDPLLVGIYMPRPVVMMSKIENFRLPIWGPMVKAYGAFPIHRGEVDRTALKKALEVLHQGEALLMAPEGTRSADGQLQVGHDGLALIATRSGAPILPFAIAGAKPVSQNIKRLRRTKVQVVIGQPIHLESAPSKANREALAALTDQVMLRLSELLPAEQRGVYRERM